MIGGITCFADDFVGNFCEHFDCEFEHTRPIHRNVGRAANLSVGDLTGYVEQVEVVAVGFEFAVDDARFVGRTQHYCACAVTEQNAGCAVVPIHDAAERFRADDQSLFRHTAFDVGIGGGQGVHKARADRLYVKCGTAVFYTELLLNDGRGGWELHIGGGGRHDNQIDFIGSDTGSNQCAA